MDLTTTTDGDDTNFDAKILIQAISAKQPRFNGLSQEDPGEFLAFLLESMEAEMADEAFESLLSSAEKEEFELEFHQAQWPRVELDQKQELVISRNPHTRLCNYNDMEGASRLLSHQDQALFHSRMNKLYADFHFSEKTNELEALGVSLPLKDFRFDTQNIFKCTECNHSWSSN